MTIHFVRHADKAKGDFFNPHMRHQDQPISSLGRKQAARLAKYLRQKNITEVYVSEYIRTMQTIQPFARRARLRPIVDARLNEIDLGFLDTMTYEEFQAKYPEAWKARNERLADFRWPGGETGEEARARIAAFVAEQSSRPGNKAVVAHDGIVRVLLCHLLGIPVVRRFDFTLGTASVMEIEWEAERAKWNLIRYNQEVY